jgi:hypothetical protein
MNRLVPMLSAMCLVGLGCAEVKQMVEERIGAEKESAVALVDSQLTKAKELLRGKTEQEGDSMVVEVNDRNGTVGTVLLGNLFSRDRI